LLQDADLLIHEATFDDEEGSDRAKEVWHSTAREAGEVASHLHPRILALVHISSRYISSANHLRDAKEMFDGEIIVPNDLTTIELQFHDD